MTGAGSSTVAVAPEDSFMTLPGTPSYFQPGRNITVEDIELSNALSRLRDPDAVEAIESIAGNLEGALSASWAMSADTHQQVRNIIFNDAGSGFTSGQAATSTWYLGVDYIGGTAERALSGVTPTEYSWSYDRDSDTITESLTAVYADESLNTSITPSSITKPSEGSTVPSHGIQLDVAGATVQKLQSATLSVSNIARLQRGASRTALDAVISQPTTTLETTAIFGGTSTIERAYGASNTTSTQDAVAGKTATATLSVEGSTVATYSLPQTKPDTYNWSDLVAGENDLTEPVTHHVNGGVSIS